jgi:glycosyltransferase involved in cell wall biosynthesis
MPPLVSVLLPTRNRLDLLRSAIETVRRQDDPDWEIVVSDNASDDDVTGHVESLGDGRIRCVQTGRPVPVTDNWNNALEHSSGRYAIMLGDDDGLMPGYVSRLRTLVERFGKPELIYSGAWLYAHPGVIAGEPSGYVQPYGYASFFRDRTEPFVLDSGVARAMVDHALHFRVRYGFNMQFSTVSRELVDRLAERGPFFQSAFPDYYATNAAFLTARRIVAEPRPLVTIGVSPKSYGYFHASGKEGEGKQFLGAVDEDSTRRRLEAAMLPGTNINVGWLSALESLRARYPEALPSEPDHGRFRLLQAAYVYEGRFLRDTVSDEQLAELEVRLDRWQRYVGRMGGRIARVARRLPRPARRALAFCFYRLLLRQFPRWDPPKIRGRYATLLDLYEDPPAGASG